MRNDNLWTMSADGTNQQQITNGSFPDAQPDWGYLTSDDGVNVQLQSALGEFELAQNYPNPFNPETIIEFRLHRLEKVDVRIYDMRGSLVRTLLEATQYSPGTHRLIWNGLNDGGMRANTGVYFYRIEADGLSQTKKMLLLQ